jgi:hypothetical protein
LQCSKAFLLLSVLAASSSAQFLPDVRVSPTRIATGSGDSVITVTGINFKPGFQVYWNGAPRPTRVVSAWTLKATIPSSDLAQPGLAQVSLYDSANGTAASNPSPLLIYLPLNSTDLAWDSTRGRIFAALTQADPNGPAIAVIDPDKGIVERYIPLPADPATLALSAGARYLYAGLKDRVRRIDLTGAQSDVDLLFTSLAQNGSTSPPTSILPLPGDGTSYVVVLGSSNYSAYAVDGTTPRPNHSNDSPRCLVAVDGTSLYGGPGFSQLNLDASGMPFAAAVAISGLAAGSYCPAFATGRMYGSNGDIVDPAVPARVGRFPAYGMVDAAPELNRVYYFGYAGLPSVTNTVNPALSVFDMSSHALLQSVSLPLSISTTLGRLIHWGSGGVAFGDYSLYNTTVSNGIYLLRVP